ncbi:MAG: hypothetical protein HFJ17_00515 [Clostridia bacterium]|nr:hypothetical protein [Clostridia bacterium]
MDKNKLKEVLEKNKVRLVSKINYRGKAYIKTIKSLKKGIEYIYYEIEDDTIKEVNDETILRYFKEMYQNKPTNIIY